MGLKALFSLNDVKRQFKNLVGILDQTIVLNLAFLGERCVIQARTLDTYKDQTGNLRASIGYVILYKGRIVKRSFAGNTPAGRAAGLKAAESLADNYPSGYTLLIIAGMNYAAAVESRGYDVVTSAELLAEREMPALIQQIKTKVNTITVR